MDAVNPSFTPCAVVFARRLEAYTKIPSPDGLRCIRVSTAYEAVAELLAGPVAALVLDMSLLRPDDKRLIDIARKAEVEIFGVGALPAGMSADQLSGVRLVDSQTLERSLADLLDKPEPDESPESPEPQEPTEPAADQSAAEGPTPDDEFLNDIGSPPPQADAVAPSTRLAPADLPPAAKSPAGEYKSERLAASVQAGKQAGRTEQADNGSAALLSPDELAALLEDQS